MAYRLLQYALCLSVSALLISCGTGSLESRGNSSYSRAKSATGDQKRLLEKEAYVYYLKAIQKYPDKSRVPHRLRNRFIEVTLSRGLMVLEQATADMQALNLFVADVDSVMSPDVPPDLKQRYAEFTARLADSMFVRNKLYATIKLLDKAAAIAANPSAIQDKKKTLIANYVNEKIELAKMQLEEGLAVKDEPKELIRAEFNAKLALYYDPNNEEAKSILGKCYQANRGTYSAYDAAIEDRPDTAVYRAINKYAILLACPAVKGGTIKVSMYNYSWNPLRLWARDFYIEDVNGKRYQALPSSRVEPEILPQEHETQKLVLNFPAPAADIKKLIYESEDKEYYSEKNFQ